MTDAKRQIAERTCVACRLKRPKGELIRIVHTPAGEIEIDPRGKKAGRGAYLCKTKECWDMALIKGRKDRLAHSLKAEVTPENRIALAGYGKTLSSNSATGEKGVE